MSTEKIEELENKLDELRTNIRTEFVWIMANRYNTSIQDEVAEREANLEILKSQYDSTENELNKAKQLLSDEQERIRDLELLAQQQRELEAIRLQEIENEQQKLNDVISKCKLIGETSIPKFEELIRLTKENIGILKDKRNNCLLEHKHQCPLDLEDKLAVYTNVYNDVKVELTSFHVDYEAESCPGESCSALETTFQEVNSAYDRKTKGLDYATTSFTSCLNSNAEKCHILLEQLKASQKKMQSQINLIPNFSENFANLTDVNERNQYLKQSQRENLKYANKNYFLQNPSKDIKYKYDSELNKNILLATLGSVLLYYIFFEI